MSRFSMGKSEEILLGFLIVRVMKESNIWLYTGGKCGKMGGRS